MGYKWHDTQAAGRPPFSEMSLLKVGDKRINKLLHDLLRNATPHPHEKAVCDIIIKHIKSCGIDTDDMNLVWKDDKHSNLFIDLRTDLTKHKTMFSAHMDTMQADAGLVDIWMTTGDDKKSGFLYAGLRQKVYTMYDPETLQEINLAKALKKKTIWNYKVVIDETQKNGDKVRANILEHFYNGNDKETDLWYWTKYTHNSLSPYTLGADDKVGCYIMCKLIEQKVPGFYVFHVGEEKGCIGSRYLSENFKDAFKGLERCVAFDRGGYKDVIARQRNAHTCSTQFTKELAAALNANIPVASHFNADVTGIYTDSACYKDLIPECTNLSVGYFDQHGPGEHMDLIWLESIFMPAVLKVNWDLLKTYRDPKYVVPTQHSTTYYGGTTRSTNTLKAAQVTTNTALWLCPPWNPKDGLIEGCTITQMKRIIESYLDIDKKFGHQKVELIYDLVKELDDLKEAHTNLRAWAFTHGADLEAAQKAPINDDPNGAFDLEQEAQDVVAELLGEQYCVMCKYVNSQCVCGQADYAHNEQVGPPKREKFGDDATFQKAITDYQMRVAGVV